MAKKLALIDENTDFIGHPRANGYTRDEIELFLRDAYSAGANAGRRVSNLTAAEYAKKEAPKLRAILAEVGE